MGQLRRTTCVVAALTMVMSAGSIILVFMAFGIRGDDLVVASSKTAFDNLGTCLSVPNKGTLENAGYNKNDFDCNGDEQKKENLQRLIAASAHSLIWASAESPGDDDLAEMATVAKTALAGGGTGVNRAVNASTFYNAVRTVDSNCCCLHTRPYTHAHSNREKLTPHTRALLTCGVRVLACLVYFCVFL